MERPGTCPIRALEAWLEASRCRFGPVFRKVDRWGNIEHARLGGDAVRDILRRRAGQAGLTVDAAERLSPHGLRAGFVTEATLAGARDEQVMVWIGSMWDPSSAPGFHITGQSEQGISGGNPAPIGVPPSHFLQQVDPEAQDILVARAPS